VGCKYEVRAIDMRGKLLEVLRRVCGSGGAEATVKSPWPDLLRVDNKHTSKQGLGKELTFLGRKTFIFMIGEAPRKRADYLIMEKHAH